MNLNFQKSRILTLNRFIFSYTKLKPLLFFLLFFNGLLILSGQNTEKIDLENLFGDIRARHIGPALMSGRINDLEIHPKNSKIIYAATAGGGVWKSNDAGTTFNPIFDEHCQSIGAIAIDPNNPDKTIYVGTGETWPRNSVSIGDGLYKSSDGGTNWDKIGFEKSERIADIIINPNNSNEIYVGVLGALWSDSEVRGVYKSLDGGLSWEKILYINESTGAADLEMDPTNSNILYASMWEFRRTAWSFDSGGENSALYKTEDGGVNWKKIHNGFPEGKLGRLAIAIAPSSPSTLYTVVEAEKPEKKGLYRSDDSGDSWKQLNNDFGITVRPFYFSRIVVDPKNSEVVIKAGLTGSISRDGGKTFKALGDMHSDIHDIIFDISDSDRIYVGTDGGIYRSWNGGITMEIVENLPLSQFYHVSVDDEDPYNVYGGLQDNGSWYGPSSAIGGVRSRNWNSVGPGDGFRVLKHPTKNIIYSEMQGAENVWRYNSEKGLIKTIQPLPQEGYPKLRFNWNAPMAVSSNYPDRFYMGSQFLHRSEDMGDTWNIISPDLTTNDPSKQLQENSGGLSADNSGAENHTTIFTIAESSLDSNIIWVGTDDGNIQISTDGGKKWKNVTPNISSLPKSTWVYHIEASVHSPGTAYAVFDGHNSGDMNAYAYKTNNYGKTWQSIILNNDVTGFVRNIQEDYINPDLLFLGTELGLYITIDGGKKWVRFKNNMPPVAVHFIDLHKKTNDLIMGTHGRGIIIVDDISPLRDISKKTLSKKLHFFESSKMIMKDKSAFVDRFGGETRFVGESSSTSGKIKYLLPKRHTFGKMSLEIKNSSGKSIVYLNPGKSKGVNIVNWGYTIKQPKVAKGKTLSYGGFTAPRVPEGVYKAVIKKGKDIFEKEFEVVYDEITGLNKIQRESKHRLTMRMYDMIQQLAYLVYELDIILDKIPSKNKIYKSLTSLKETLVITTGDNYVGSVESQLREKMTSLYSKISDSYDAPSNTEKNNFELIEKRFEKANKLFDKLKERAKIDDLKIDSFEDFISK
jgi:photosystem II stability/assembly factor-like uncharacterized protein